MENPTQLKREINRLNNELTALEKLGITPPDNELFKIKIRVTMLKKTLTLTELVVMYSEKFIDLDTLTSDAKYLYPYTFRSQLLSLGITLP
jgi:hypothetical protein